MARNEQSISADDLKKIFTADFDAGVLYWAPRAPGLFGIANHNPWNAKYAGKPAYARPRGDGYLQVRVNGRDFTYHRVLLALATGRWAPEMVDHVNGDRADNRLINLREVTASENNRNMGLLKSNKTGRVGVTPAPRAGTYVAAITVNRKPIYLGTFDKFEDACAARAAAEARLGFHANHGAAR